MFLGLSKEGPFPVNMIQSSVMEEIRPTLLLKQKWAQQMECTPGRSGIRPNKIVERRQRLCAGNGK